MKTKNHKIFVAGFAVFLLIVIAISIDMARRTTAPWNKPKQLERALPSAGSTQADTNSRDTIR